MMSHPVAALEPPAPNFSHLIGCIRQGRSIDDYPLEVSIGDSLLNDFLHHWEATQVKTLGCDSRFHPCCEHGSLIVLSKGGEEVPEEEIALLTAPRAGTPEWINVHPKELGTKDFIGVYHTHPYKPAEEGNIGLAFSCKDFYVFCSDKRMSILVAHSGDYVYLLARTAKTVTIEDKDHRAIQGLSVEIDCASEPWNAEGQRKLLLTRFEAERYKREAAMRAELEAQGKEGREKARRNREALVQKATLDVNALFCDELHIALYAGEIAPRDAKPGLSPPLRLTLTAPALDAPLGGGPCG